MISTAKHKYATIGFVYLFGLICASFLESAACFIIFAVMTVIFGISIGKSDVFFKINLTVAAAAFLVFGLYRAVYIDSCVSLIGKKQAVVGTVTECRAPDNDTVLLNITGTAGGKFVKLTLFTADTGIDEGDTVKFDAVFSEFTDTAEFSESSYYFSKGIFLKAYPVGDIEFTKAHGGIREYISRISDYFKSIADSVFDSGEGGIIKAMFFGDKSDLSYRTKVDIRRSGISHLTAVSGMHLSLIVHFFAGFLGVIFRRGGRGYFVIITAYVAFLMVFFGMTASVMRSGFMMIVYYGSDLLKRKSDTLCAVGAALMIILLLNPCACRDTGLMMSVLGTLGVGVVAPMAADGIGMKRHGFIKNTLFTSACAFLCTMPMGALCFGGVSFVASVTGLLVQPFFTVILMLVPVAVILPFLSKPLLLTAGAAAWCIEKISAFISGFDFSYVEIDSGIIAVSTVLIIAGTFFTFTASKSTRGAVVFASVCLVSLAASCALNSIIGYNDIRIKVLTYDKNAYLKVTDKTGISFYSLTGDSGLSDRFYEYSAGSKVNFICFSDNVSDKNCFEIISDNVHFPEKGLMDYSISGEYSALTTKDGIILDIRGITVGLLPAGNETGCDIAVYSGYKENYGKAGKTATILCDKKYYNCEGTVNAFLTETEIIINSEGMYALVQK